MTIKELHQHTRDLLAAAGIKIEKEELNSNNIPKEEEKPREIKIRFIKKVKS